MPGDDPLHGEAVIDAPPKGGAFFSFFDRLVSGMNALGTAWIFVLIIMINADAFGRTLFAAPIDGVIELVELSLVGIVFLQLADATRRGRLTRSDGFFNMVMARNPRIGRYMGATSDLVGAVFMAIIVYGSVPLLLDSIKHDYYVGNEGVFTAPVWPIKTIILIGCVVATLQFLVFVWRYLAGVHAIEERRSEGNS